MSKLSFLEAVVLGSLIRPQGFYSRQNSVGSCVVGAAMEAVSGDCWGDLNNHFPFIYKMREKCPVPGCGDHGSGTIFHLNDTHRWNRVRIAEWADQFDPASQPSQAEEVEEVTCKG